jgi:hypothetical protein
MSWSNTSASPRMNQDRDQIHTSAAASLTGANDPNNFLFQGHASMEYAVSFDRNSVQLQSAISPGLPGVHNSHALTSPTNRSEPQNMEVPSNSETMHQFMEQPTTSLDVNTSTDIEHTRHENAASEPWYQTNFSSINWLPDNWTPDFQMDGNLGPFDQSIFFGQTPQTSNVAYSISHQNQTSPPQFSQTRDSLRRRSQAIDQEVSSPSSQSTRSGGHFYVDGDGARLPRVRKIPYRHSDSYAHASTTGTEEVFPAFMFPENIDLPEVTETKQIAQDTYTDIIESFARTCMATDHYSKFRNASFPTRQVVSRCILLYRDNFESILPFIHPATFDISSSHWLLILAMAAVGSHYLDIEHSEVFSIAMHEFLRRAIETMVTSSRLLL